MWHMISIVIVSQWWMMSMIDGEREFRALYDKNMEEKLNDTGRLRVWRRSKKAPLEYQAREGGAKYILKDTQWYVLTKV